jgi:hypothetical protein
LEGFNQGSTDGSKSSFRLLCENEGKSKRGSIRQSIKKSLTVIQALEVTKMFGSHSLLILILESTGIPGTQQTFTMYFLSE